jgi:hypothetical protein
MIGFISLSLGRKPKIDIQKGNSSVEAEITGVQYQLQVLSLQMTKYS